MKRLLTIILIFAVSAGLQAQITADFTSEDVCLGDTSVFINASTSSEPIAQIFWDLDSDGQFDDASGDTTSWIFETHGYKNIGIRIVTENNFSNANYKQVYIAENPLPNFNLRQPCSGVPTIFENRVQLEEGQIESFYYTFGDGSGPSTQESPSHVYDVPGSYQVYIQTTTSFGCVNENDRTIEIRQSPDLELNVPADTSLGITGSVTLEVLTPYDSIRWSTGETVSQITVTEPGIYTVTVYENSCPTSQSVDVQDEGSGSGTPIPGEFDVMTLITPNNDGFNDRWQINNITQKSPCQVSVFTRDGVLVFSSNDYQNDWTGDFKGKPLPEGSYYYVIECSNNEVVSGTLSILR